MNQELARKKPAQVVPARRTQPAVPEVQDLETWTDTRYALLAKVRQAESRGEVATVGSWKPVPGWPGSYSVEVRRLKSPRPVWVPWAAGAAGGSVVLGGIGYALILVLPLLLKVLAVAVGLAILAGLMVRAVRGGSITINQNVNIR